MKSQSEFMEETMMDKKTQKIGVICSIVQIILSIICLIYSAINQENIIMWVLFLCSGILSLSSNISRNNKKEDEWGSANSSLQNWLKRARRSSFSFFIIVSLWYNRDIRIGSLQRGERDCWKISNRLSCGFAYIRWSCRMWLAVYNDRE